jgi:hypothetical protein
MIELGAARIQAGLDVAEAFPPGQLSESHANKLAPAGELTNFVITAKTGDAALELLGMNGLKKLRQDKFSRMHPRTMKEAK